MLGISLTIWIIVYYFIYRQKTNAENNIVYLKAVETTENVDRVVSCLFCIQKPEIGGLSRITDNCHLFQSAVNQVLVE